MHEYATILDALHMDRTLQRLATEVVERRGSDLKLALLGIQRRGADLAKRIKIRIDALRGTSTPLGKLDINLYRDDWTTLDTRPSITCTDIPFDIEDTSIVLVDDVLFSGRTVRSALEAILDYGRPRRVELLVLIDRGGRELPIQADYVGKTVTTQTHEHVNVLVNERDGEDKVCLVRP